MLLMTIVVASFFVLKIILGPFGPKKTIVRYGSLVIVSAITLLLVYDCTFGVTTEDIKVYRMPDFRASGTTTSLKLEDNNNNVYWGFLSSDRIDTSRPLRITYLGFSKYIYKVYQFDEASNRYIEVFDHHLGLLLFGSGFYLFDGMIIYYYIKSKKRKKSKL